MGKIRRRSRGGSWYYSQDHCRAAYRYGRNPGYRSDYFGFRLVSKEKKVNVTQQGKKIMIGSKTTVSATPSWASAHGTDTFGTFAEFKIKEVTQRMRWVEPGDFIMGSPEDEPTRYSDEGPQHKVTIKEGFWMFDTPCTQALWAAVMEDHPSHFVSATRPVEQVSWNRVQTFIEKINLLLPGVELALPSESQWEYACRAGSEGPVYETEGKGDALDRVAWHSGNSMNDYELKDSAGTHPVAQKLPNKWGLYDMLGNVWEWVQDTWHGNYEGAPTDGSPWID